MKYIAITLLIIIQSIFCSSHSIVFINDTHIYLDIRDENKQLLSIKQPFDLNNLKQCQNILSNIKNIVRIHDKVIYCTCFSHIPYWFSIKHIPFQKSEYQKTLIDLFSKKICCNKHNMIIIDYNHSKIFNDQRCCSFNNIHSNIRYDCIKNDHITIIPYTLRTLKGFVSERTLLKISNTTHSINDQKNLKEIIRICHDIKPSTVLMLEKECEEYFIDFLHESVFLDEENM